MSRIFQYTDGYWRVDYIDATGRRRRHKGAPTAKVAREILVKDQIATRSAAFLNGLLYPHKHLQERLYSILPMVAEHGLELIDRLYDHVQLDCPDHRLITV